MKISLCGIFASLTVLFIITGFASWLGLKIYWNRNEKQCDDSIGSRLCDRPDCSDIRVMVQCLDRSLISRQEEMETLCKRNNCSGDVCCFGCDFSNSVEYEKQMQKKDVRTAIGLAITIDMFLIGMLVITRLLRTYGSSDNSDQTKNELKELGDTERTLQV